MGGGERVIVGGRSSKLLPMLLQKNGRCASSELRELKTKKSHFMDYNTQQVGVINIL